MAGMTPLPPTVLHSTTRLTHAQAHTQLSQFLEQAEHDAAYRPDSTLGERGPQSASTGANPNLTLHHLNRILQGIEGKRIGGEDMGRFFGDGAVASNADRFRGTKRRMRETTTTTNGFGYGSAVNGGGADDDNDDDQTGRAGQKRGRHAQRQMVEDQHPEDGPNDVGIAVDEEGDGWQDKDDYDLAQREGALELLDDERQPGMSLEQPADDVEADDMMDVEIQRTGKKVNPAKQAETNNHSGMVDKAARKKAKRDRLKEDKKQRQEAKKGK